MDSINRIRSVFDPFGTAKPAAPKKQAPKWIQDAIAPQRAKPNLTPRAAPPASISATPFTLGGWLEDKTGRALGDVFGEREGARLGAKLFSAINDFTPVGDAVGMDEGGRQVYHGLSRGHLGQAALGAGAFALSALPGAIERPLRASGSGFARLLRDERGSTRGFLGEPSQLNYPRNPTVDEMRRYSTVQSVPLSQARHGNGLSWDRFEAGDYGHPLVEGYADKPLAVQLQSGEYILLDGNHRSAAAQGAGQSRLDMHVIAAKDYDPANMGRAAAPTRLSDSDLAALLAEFGQDSQQEPAPRRR